jgi:hypothetical protein
MSILYTCETAATGMLDVVHYAPREDGIQGCFTAFQPARG